MHDDFDSRLKTLLRCGAFITLIEHLNHRDYRRKPHKIETADIRKFFDA